MKNHIKCIVIGGSAGSFTVMMEILQNLPKDFSLPILICMHRMKHGKEGFANALNLKSNLNLVEPYDKEKIKKNSVFLAPANYHMCVEMDKTISLSTEEDYNYSRPAIDLLFKSASYVYKKHLLGIILSGANHDGAIGLKCVKDCGGMTIIQSISESQVPTMPKSAKKKTQIDFELNTRQITEFLIQIHKTKQIQLVS
ncbi:chemotaxis protein CheB [Paracrocinitomix mangrovi]|uniref:chemotaxis protein CheB n=1 Tax=Paracrocinitomix mangrovi TaxID=2862509 RepID=UPI001C8EA0D7|nr:chemotaxis protein CheB [Paracrocinitomix mangrovi]UKN01615.1 chemotaxis protein CheB [Paracrocinitomix mangrovi]